MTDTIDQIDTMDQTWEFKGIEILAPSYSRKSNIISLLNSSNFGPTDAATFLFGCICPEAELRKGRRKPEDFDAEVAKWMDKIKYGPSDYAAAAELFSAIMQHSNSNRAVPISDPSLEPDPLGN